MRRRRAGCGKAVAKVLDCTPFFPSPGLVHDSAVVPSKSFPLTFARQCRTFHVTLVTGRRGEVMAALSVGGMMTQIPPSEKRGHTTPSAKVATMSKGSGAPWVLDSGVRSAIVQELCSGKPSGVWHRSLLTFCCVCTLVYLYT